MIRFGATEIFDLKKTLWALKYHIVGFIFFTYLFWYIAGWLGIAVWCILPILMLKRFYFGG